MIGGPQAVGLRPEEIAGRQPAASGKADLHQAAVAFEGMVVSILFQTMRKTVQPSGLLGDSGQAKGTLEYLFDQAVVDAAMKGGRTWGLARRLEEAWKAKESRPESVQSKAGQVSPVEGR